MLKVIRSGALGSYDDNAFPFEVLWRITGRCPYNCSYCYERDRHKEAGEGRIEEIETAVPHLKTLLATLPGGRETSIKLFGGEPTVHKNFMDIVGILVKNMPAAKLSCFTNLFRPISFFEDLLKIAPGFAFDISAHFENIVEEDFLAKLALLHEAGSTIRLYIQFLPSYRDNIHSLSSRIHAAFPSIKIFIQFLRSRESKFRKLMPGYLPGDHEFAKKFENEPQYFIDYSDEHGRIFRRVFTFDEAFTPSLSNFKGARCLWPMQRLTIAENGNARTGFCLPQPVYNLYKKQPWEETPTMFERPAICAQDFCVCRGMRDAPKWYMDEAAPIFMGGLASLSSHQSFPEIY